MAHLQETEAPGPKKMKLSQDHPEYEVVDSEYRQEDNWTPLHEAADRVDIPKLKYLLNLGKFDVNAVTKETNMTALHFAVQAWHTPDNRGRQPEAVKLLLENGAAVDPHDYVGKTPLHMSVQTDSLDVTRMLIERGANVNVGSQESERPSEPCGEGCEDGCACGNRSALQGILAAVTRQHFSSANFRKDATPLHDAATAGNYKQAKLLLETLCC